MAAYGSNIFILHCYFFLIRDICIRIFNGMRRLSGVEECKSRISFAV